MIAIAIALEMRWTGPFKIVEEVGDVTYRIKREGQSRSVVVHYNRIKPFVRRNSEESTDSGSDTHPEPSLPAPVEDDSLADDGYAGQPGDGMDECDDGEMQSAASDDGGRVDDDDRSFHDDDLSLNQAPLLQPSGLATSRLQRQRRPPIWQRDYCVS